jgi:AcrR family transcriptional regulator
MSAKTAPHAASAQHDAAARASARDRLLAAASELFYAEGTHTVGIDRIIERAGVAKASLYNTFGSKDELIRAYLEARHARVAKRITAAIERHETPREKLLAIFDAQSEQFHDPTYRGCAFVNASAETQPGSVVEQASDDYRSWVRGTFAKLARDAGAADPETLARHLVLLYDGAGVAARMDRTPDAAMVARSTAEILLDSSLPQRRGLRARP